MTACLLWLALACGGKFHPLTAIHVAVAAADGASTLRWPKEGDPLAAAVIGRRPQAWRMAVAGAAEVDGVELLPRRWRRVARIALVVAHGEGVAWNLTRKPRGRGK